MQERPICYCSNFKLADLKMQIIRAPRRFLSYQKVALSFFLIVLTTNSKIYLENTVTQHVKSAHMGLCFVATRCHCDVKLCSVTSSRHITQIISLDKGRIRICVL